MRGETSGTVEGVARDEGDCRKTALVTSAAPEPDAAANSLATSSVKKELGIVEARRLIYVPTYEWVLENRIDSGVDSEVYRLGVGRCGPT